MRWLPFVLACAAAAGSAGQEAQPPVAVHIDAVVTDRTGRPLGNLTASDFELRAAGVIQAIDRVELRTTTSAADTGRVFALLLDEFHVSPGPNSERVRRTVGQFIDEHVRATDRVAVMKPLDSQLVIAFTGDRSAWQSALDAFEGRAGDFTPRTPFEEQYLGRAPALVETSRAQIVTSALRALVARLGESAPGRTAVAFVSEGFAAGGRADRERRLPDFQGVVRIATRANVAIYTLNPEPAAARGDASARDRMTALAAGTAGESASGEEIGAALARMSRDLDTYYVLTFTPSQPDDGRFHRLELTSRRRNAIVRAPGGFWMPVPSAAIVPTASPRPTRSPRKSALIDTWYGIGRLADGRMRLRVTWEPSRRKVAGRREPDAIVLRAARPGGPALYEGRLPAAHLAEVVVPAGRVELDLTVVSADGTEIDREARDIDVPEPTALLMTRMAPEIIRARTLREFRAASVDPAAAPTPVREFRRADHLIVRAAVLSSEADPLNVAARLLNRWGQPMRELQAIDAPGSGLVQFDLPLAWLVPGEYEIELRTTYAGADATQKIPVKVIG